MKALNDSNPQTLDFTVFLHEELIRRCAANPQYSMRAFARSLKMDHSTLSRVMRGERKMNVKHMRKIGEQLALAPEIIKAYEAGLSKGFYEFAVDHFKVMSDWYHYAIFELVTLRNFVPEYAWIAKKLSISVEEAELAVERLMRVGLLRIDKKGKWLQSTPRASTVSYPYTTAGLRKYQKQLLELSSRSIEVIPIELRDQTSAVFAINTARLADAKIRIKKFRRRLSDHLQSDNDRDAVYQLQVSLFPVTRPEDASS